MHDTNCSCLPEYLVFLPAVSIPQSIKVCRIEGCPHIPGFAGYFDSQETVQCSLGKERYYIAFFYERRGESFLVDRLNQHCIIQNGLWQWPCLHVFVTWPEIWPVSVQRGRCRPIVKRYIHQALPQKETRVKMLRDLTTKNGYCLHGPKDTQESHSWWQITCYQEGTLQAPWQ